MPPIVRLQYGCNHTIQIPGKANSPAKVTHISKWLIIYNPGGVAGAFKYFWNTPPPFREGTKKIAV